MAGEQAVLPHCYGAGTGYAVSGHNTNLAEILGAYLLVLGKVKRKMPPPKEAFSGIVKRRVVSVQSRILTILHTLYRQKNIDYKACLVRSEDRSEMVATFLAVLELVKSKRIVVDESGQIGFGQNRTPMPAAAQDEEEDQ